MPLASIDFASASNLGLLNGDSPLSLGNKDSPGDDKDKTQDQKDKLCDADFAGLGGHTGVPVSEYFADSSG